MGNCMQGRKKTVERGREDDEGVEVRREEEAAGDGGRGGCGKGGMKVRMVLTREQLEKLLYQLDSNGGKLRTLVDFLGEFDKEGLSASSLSLSSSFSSSSSSRAYDESWRPSLETIVECPEGFEIDT